MHQERHCSSELEGASNETNAAPAQLGQACEKKGGAFFPPLNASGPQAGSTHDWRNEGHGTPCIQPQLEGMQDQTCPEYYPLPFALPRRPKEMSSLHLKHRQRCKRLPSIAGAPSLFQILRRVQEYQILKLHHRLRLCDRGAVPGDFES